MADSAATLASLRLRLVNSEKTYNSEMQELVALMNRAVEWTDLMTNPRVKTHAFTTAKVKACSDRLLAQAEANEADLYKCFAAYLDNSAEFLTYCTQLHDMRSSLLAAGSKHPFVGKTSFSSVYHLERALLPLYRLSEVQVLLQDIRQVLLDTRRREELSRCDQSIQQVTELSTRCTRLLTRVDGCTYIHSLSELFQDSPQHTARSSKQNLSTKPAPSKCQTNTEPSETNRSKTKMYSNPGAILSVFDEYSSHPGRSLSVTGDQLLGSTDMYRKLNEIVPKTSLPVESRQTTTKNKSRNASKQECATEIKYTSEEKPFQISGKSTNVGMKCTNEYTEPSETNRSKTKMYSNPGAILSVFDEYSSHPGRSVSVTGDQLLGSTDMCRKLNDIVPNTSLPLELRQTSTKNKSMISSKQECATEIKYTSEDKPFQISGKSTNVGIKCTNEDTEPSDTNCSKTKMYSNPGAILSVFDEYSSHSGRSVSVTGEQLLGSTDMCRKLNDIVPKTSLSVESRQTTTKYKSMISSKQECATEIKYTSEDKPFQISGKSTNVGMKSTNEDSFRTGRSVFYDRGNQLNDNTLPSSSQERSTAWSQNNSLSPVTEDATFKTLLDAKLSDEQLPQREIRCEHENGANDSVQQIERKMQKLERKRKSLEAQLATARSNVSASGDHNEKRDSDYFSNLSNVSSSESLNSAELAQGPSTDSVSDTTVDNLRVEDSDTRGQERSSHDNNGDTSKTTDKEPSKAFQHYEEPLLRGTTLRRAKIGRWKNTTTKVRPHSMHSEFYSTKYIRGDVTRSLLRDSIRRAPLYQTYHPKKHDGDSHQDLTELTKTSGEHAEYQNVNPSFRARMVQESIPSEKENIAASCDTRCSYQGIINGVEITYENIKNENNGSSIIGNVKVNGGVRAKCDLELGNENAYCEMTSRKKDLVKKEFPKYDLTKYLTNVKRLDDQDNMHGEYVQPSLQNYHSSSDSDDTFQVINNNLKRDDSSNIYESVHDLFADIHQVNEARKVLHHLKSDDSANIYESVHDLFADIHKGKQVEKILLEEQPAKNSTKEAIRWCDIPEVISSGLLDDLDKRARCLQEAKYEIISSKVSYLKSLSILQVLFIQNQNLSDVLPADDWSNLFGHIEPIKRCSEHFLADLLSGWPQDLLLSKMATVVNQYAQSGLQVYVDFCANHVRMNDTLRDIRESRPSVNKILERLEADEVCENLPIESFLMSPVKRVTRLPLLVGAVLHWLEPGGEDHAAWSNTFEQLQAMANACNEAVRAAEADKERQTRTDTEVQANTNSLRKKPQGKKVKKRSFFFHMKQNVE